LEVPCIPLSDEGFTTTVPNADGLEWSAPAPDVVGVEVLKVPEGVEITLEDGTMFVRRGAEGETGCATVRVTNKCSNAVWSFEIPPQCILPCPALAPKIQADTTGEATTTIRLPAAATEVLGTTGLSDAAVSVFGTSLTVLGTVQSGPYTITLDSVCGPCTITGVVSVEAEEPPCLPIRLVSSTGNFSADIGAEVNICYVLAGTKVVQMMSFEGLPLGLSVSVTDDGGNTKVCITGTVTEDKCTPDAGCRTGKITLRNCAGDFELQPKIFITPPNQTLPFCAGLVRIEDVSVAGSVSRCWKITASRFSANSELFIRTNLLGDDYPATDANENLSGDLTITLDDQGNGTGTVCVSTATQGCNAMSLVGYHPTCGVISTATVITPSFLYQQCPGNNAGG